MSLEIKASNSLAIAAFHLGLETDSLKEKGFDSAEWVASDKMCLGLEIPKLDLLCML